MSSLLPAAATLTGTTLVVPGLALAAGQRVTLLYVNDAGEEIPLSTWQADQDLAGKADEDARFSLISTLDPALPESAIRGLIDWHYEEPLAGGLWELKAGRCVMFSASSQLRVPANAQEGDVFGVYFNPLATANRILLNFAGGIDEQKDKRYLPGSSVVFRYTLIPAYANAAGALVAAHYGLRTIQQTSPNAANYRGDYSPSAYYVPGDLVVYQSALYLRLVEGNGNGTTFEPTKWVGGGAAIPPPDPQVVTSTVLKFDKNYVHVPISSGTFTVDLAGLVIGKEVKVYLTATASDPANNLPAPTFQLVHGAYKSGVELMYTFFAGGNGKIQYTIHELR